MKLKLHWQILIAIVLASVIGWAAGEDGAIAGVRLYPVFDFLGTLFINALKMLIVPLIASSIIVGIAGIGSKGDLGKLGGQTVACYAVTTLSAILVGLVLVNIVRPGIVDGEPAGKLLALEVDSGAVAEQIGDKGAADVIEVFLRAVPPNIIDAAGKGEMLGIIFFCVLFGFFMSRLEHGLAEPLFNFWSGVFQVMMKITEWVMKFAPIGVFGLVARVVARTGFDAAKPLLIFAIVVLLALAIHVFVTLSLLLKWVGRVSPMAALRTMSSAKLMAFSTASSSATLPVTFECLEKGAGVSNRTTSFVLPLGATVNMDGTALYECMAALFLAQAYGLELGFVTQFSVVVVALLTSVGVAGIPSASLVAIAIILAAIGLPVEAIGVLFVFDRILDMARTSVNVFGDSTCAILVARFQGETGILEK